MGFSTQQHGQESTASNHSGHEPLHCVNEGEHISTINQNNARVLTSHVDIARPHVMWKLARLSTIWASMIQHGTTRRSTIRNGQT